MKDSGKMATGLVTIIVLIVGFILFAQYAVATNPCNTKAYKRSLPSYSSYSSSTTYKPSYTPQPSSRPSATPKLSTRSTKKSSSSGLNASDYYHPDDFYYDYYDDFYDYEEAEDYYSSHGGK